VRAVLPAAPALERGFQSHSGTDRRGTGIVKIATEMQPTSAGWAGESQRRKKNRKSLCLRDFVANPFESTFTGILFALA